MKKSKIFGIVIIAVDILLLLAVILVFTIWGRTKKEKVAEDLARYVAENDADSLKLLFDRKFVSILKDDASEYNMNIDDYIQAAYIDYVTESIKEEIGDIDAISCSIKDIYEYQEDELTETRESMQDEYGISIKEAGELEMVWYVTGTDGTSKSYNVVAWIYKRGFKWYLMDFDIE